MKVNICLILGLVFLNINKAYAYDDGDFQVWHNENQEFKINKNAKILFEEEFRFGDDAREFYYHHYDISFIYLFTKFFEFGGGFRQIYEKKSGKFKEENSPFVKAILKYSLFGFDLDDGNRFEYRNFDYSPDLWRYRNKLTVKFPWELTKLEIRPYLANEIFFDFEDATLSRNRFYSGLGFKIFKSVTGEIYYLLQTTKGIDTWTDANVLGTKIKIVF
jgi:hypothetical protein